MSRTAKVTSIDVIPLLTASLQKFRGEAGGAMDDLEIELRRALEWIHHERREYWTHELRLAQESLSQARLQLQQAMVTKRVDDRQPACSDEKRVVERAKRRVERAQRKLEAVRRWAGVIDRAADDLRRSRTQFVTWLDVDLTRATTALNLMSESLVRYISLEAPEAAGACASPEETDNSGDGSSSADKTSSEATVSPSEKSGDAEKKGTQS